MPRRKRVTGTNLAIDLFEDLRDGVLVAHSLDGAPCREPVAAAPMAACDSADVGSTRRAETDLRLVRRELHEQHADVDARDEEEVVDDLEAVPGLDSVVLQEVEVHPAPHDPSLHLDLKTSEERAEHL